MPRGDCIAETTGRVRGDDGAGGGADTTSPEEVCVSDVLRCFTVKRKLVGGEFNMAQGQTSDSAVIEEEISKWLVWWTVVWQE